MNALHICQQGWKTSQLVRMSVDVFIFYFCFILFCFSCEVHGGDGWSKRRCHHKYTMCSYAGPISGMDVHLCGMAVWTGSNSLLWKRYALIIESIQTFRFNPRGTTHVAQSSNFHWNYWPNTDYLTSSHLKYSWKFQNMKYPTHNRQNIAILIRSFVPVILGHNKHVSLPRRWNVKHMVRQYKR